jgi:putative FmdB family regulatory protein
VDQFIVSSALREAAFLGGQFEGFFAVELGLMHQLFDAGGQRLRGVGVGTRFGGIGRTDQQGDFATSGACFEGGGDLRKFAAEKLLVEFGDFAGEAGGAIAENLAGVGDGFGDAVRRFIKDEGAVFDAQAFESAAALAAASGKKTDEQKFFVGKARSGKGSEQRGWAGDRDDGNVVAQAERDQAVAGIGDQRHSGVADESDFRALLQGQHEFGCAGQLVVFVVADERLVNVVVREELLGVAGILAGDLVHFLEHADGAQRDVLEIADGRPDKIEAAGRVFGTCRRSLCVHAEESSTRAKSSRRACYTLSFEQLIGGALVPLYEYKCRKCGRNTEKIEGVSGPYLKKCPYCGGKVEAVITAPSIQFKGAGWYVTDYGGKKSGADGEKADQPAVEAKETASKEKDSSSKEKDTAKKETPSKESKEKKPATKK